MQIYSLETPPPAGAPTLSIVMVTYHTGPVLFRALEAAIVQQGLQELIIVDNGNPVTTLERLQRFAEHYPQVKLLTGHGNIGFARGCNMGFTHTNAEYVLFLNPDCIIPTNGLQTAMYAMRASPRAWLAGARLVHPDGHVHRGNRRNTLTPMTLLSQGLKLYRLSRKKFPSLNQDDRSASMTPVEVPAISGAFMLLKHVRFEWLGKFDEHYQLHVEDLDLCKRIEDLGGKTMYMPALRVVHYRSSSRAPAPVVEWKKLRGLLHYFTKHYSTSLPVGLLPFITVMLFTRFTLIATVGVALRALKGLFRRSRTQQETKKLSILEEKRQPSLLLQQDGEVVSKFSAHEPVLLLGTSSLVGTYILRDLANHGVRTYAMYHRDTLEFSHHSVTWVQGDLTTGQWFAPFPEVETEAVRGQCPHTVISAAPIWLLPHWLPRFAAMGVKRLVCFSTTSIESKAESGSIYEQDLVSKCAQAEEKLIELCPKLGIAYTILRPTMIYGAGMDKNVSIIARTIRKLGFFPVTPQAQGKRQPVHAEDLAELVLKCLEQPVAVNKRYTVCGGSTLSYTEMVDAIGAALGKKGKVARVVKHLPLWLSLFGMLSGKRWMNAEIAHRMAQDLAFDDSSVRQELGFVPRAFLVNGKADLGF